MFLQDVMEGNRPRNETAGVNNIVTASERNINGTWPEEAEFPQTVNGAWGSLGVPQKKRNWSATATFPQHLYKLFCQPSAADKGYGND